MKENFVIYNEEYDLIKKILEDLRKNTKAEIVFIIDSEGHCIASTGELDDTYLSSISSLIAGSIAAVNSVAQMLNIESFTNILTESVKKSLHVSLINDKAMLIIIFDRSSNLGLVRFRVKSSLKELEKVFIIINEKLESEDLKEDESPFNGVSDEDIDEIFGD